MQGDALDMGNFTGDFCFILQGSGFKDYGLELYENWFLFLVNANIKL